MAIERLFIGIDPGANGAVATISDNVQRITTQKYTNETLPEMLSKIKEQAVAEGYSLFCTLEQVHSMPHDGKAAAFKFGQNFGFVLGVMSALKIPYQLTPPAKWKREYSLLKQPKTESIKACKRLFPDVSLLPTPQCRKDSDGLAEALLICEYGRRKFK